MSWRLVFVAMAACLLFGLLFASCKEDTITFTGGDPADGDKDGRSDGDASDGDGSGCWGACDSISDISFCAAGDLCVCEGGRWNFYFCDDNCASHNQASAGCGEEEDFRVDHCLCRDAPDGDPSTDGDDCGGTCDATLDTSFCVRTDVCVCEGGQWNLYACDDICASQGGVARGCGMNDEFGIDYCLCTDAPDGDVPPDGDYPIDGDMPDGDFPLDGDTPDGDIPDGDLPDGDTPSDCRGACDPTTDMPFCSTTADLLLCWCNADTSVWETLDCNEVCRNEGYADGADSCDFGELGHDTCYCNSGECESDDDCHTGYICVAMQDEQGQVRTECIQTCEINTCDPGADTIACIDFGPAGQPVGLCADFEDAPGCETQGEACIDENHYCYPLRDYNACWEYCAPIPNNCESEDELCLPLTSGESPDIVGGACL
ncbi:MAG: hypothetical protein C4523_10405 [Myxococcales bacterium]|nr:MAG: hypothetical protein C4523_10405 [Myxococcales bacterium]